MKHAINLGSQLLYLMSQITLYLIWTKRHLDQKIVALDFNIISLLQLNLYCCTLVPPSYFNKV